MAFNLIGFAVARSEAEKRNLSTSDASRIGVLASLLPNPVMSMVVARSLADKQAANEPSTATVTGPPVRLVPPKEEPSGEEPSGEEPSGEEPTSDPSSPDPTALLEHVELATAEAKLAHGAAEEAKVAAVEAKDAAIGAQGEASEAKGAATEAKDAAVGAQEVAQKSYQAIQELASQMPGDAPPQTARARSTTVRKGRKTT